MTDLRELLRKAREEVYARIPSKLIRIRDGEPFQPGPFGIQQSFGGPEPKAGDFAGYDNINTAAAGNWSAGMGPWTVVAMKWVDNPEYARVWALIDAIDAALAQQPEPVAFHMHADKTTFTKEDVEAITTIAVAASREFAPSTAHPPDAKPAERLQRLAQDALNLAAGYSQRVERSYKREDIEFDRIQAELRAIGAAPQPPAGKSQEKRAPVQGYVQGIPWEMHLRAYDAYCKKYGPQPAMIDLEGRNCRGGFGTSELDEFIPGWRDELEELLRLRKLGK